MKPNHDFIQLSENLYSEDFCNSIIQLFEWSNNAGASHKRDNAAHEKSDTAVFVTPELSTTLGLSLDRLSVYQDQFTSAFWPEYYKYCDTYSILYGCGAHTVLTLKIQKTTIGEGYHSWHFEQDCRDRAARLGTWRVYLNDVEEGGETEFLYQHKRIKPTRGTLLIWPAGYTHTHRGNPPISNDKYVMTGWLEFTK